MISREVKDILEYFNEILKDAKCELNYTCDYELVIAVMLSAQTTDKRVNEVTSILFKEYDSLEKLALASEEDIEKIIRPVGLSKNKAHHVKMISLDLINKLNGKVPSSKEELMSLSGVGNKTANVVRIELFKIPEIPVDTHIERISKRLKLASINDSVLVVEQKLRRKFPKETYIKFHHQMIHFGRLICKAQKPLCEQCKLHQYCLYYKKENSIK
jgi:endonuclease-3